MILSDVKIMGGESRRSAARASVIAARKFLHVSGGFGEPRSLRKEREAERRKAHLGNGRGLLPGLPENRGTRQRLSASRRGDFFVPGTALPAQARASSPSRQAFAHPSPAPPSHLRQSLVVGTVGYPRPPECAGQRLPHARRRRSHPAPRSVLGNAPQWDGIGINLNQMGILSSDGNIKFVPHP